MNIFKIISAIIFYLALSSWGLVLEQEKTPIEEKMGMFRSSVVVLLITLPSFILIIASGIILFLYSWKILIIIFIISALLYPFIGRWIVLRLWLIPVYFLDMWAEKNPKKTINKIKEMLKKLRFLLISKTIQHLKQKTPIAGLFLF